MLAARHDDDDDIKTQKNSKLRFCGDRDETLNHAELFFYGMWQNNFTF